MRGKKRVSILGIFVGLLAAGVVVFLQKDTLQQKLFSPEKSVQGAVAPITKEEPVVTCSTGDKKCNVKNEKIVINKLTGQSVEFAKHQCDGPRACPTPDVESNDAAISAIRSSARDTKLELTRITGINASGIVYYCATGEQCWSYDTKSKKVSVVKKK